MVTLPTLVTLIIAGCLVLPSIVVISKAVFPPNKVTSIRIHMLSTSIHYSIADPVQDYLGMIEIPHLSIFGAIACLAIAGLIQSL